MVTITNQIKACLSVCGITVVAQQNYLIDQEGLLAFDSFCIIQAKDFDMVASRAAKHTPPFTLGVVKIRSLRALKFWIEDQIRFDATATIRHLQFNTATLKEYVLIGDNEEQDENEIAIGPILDPLDWEAFDTGTYKYLNTRIGRGGAPISYVIRDDTTRPDDVDIVTRADKIYWNAQLTGAVFDHDRTRVWGYLSGRIQSTDGWNFLKKYTRSQDARQGWEDLRDFYGGPAELTKRVTIARAALAVLSYKDESIFTFSLYVTQMTGHFDALKK